MNGTRTNKFTRLAQRYPSQKAMAEALGLAQPHVSQILAGIRALGDIAVQRIERKLHLPDGWFDSEAMSPAVDEVAISFDTPKRPGPQPRERSPREMARGDMIPAQVKARELPGAEMPAFQERLIQQLTAETRDIEDALITLCERVDQVEVFHDVRFRGPLGFVQVDMVVALPDHDVAIERLRMPGDRASLVRSRDRVIAQLVRLKHSTKVRPLKTAIIYTVTAPHRSAHFLPQPKHMEDQVTASLVEQLDALKGLGYIDGYAEYPNLSPLAPLLK